MNILTNTMDKMYKLLGQTDQKLKAMGKTPYGRVKTTSREQRQMAGDLSPEEVTNLIQTFGVENVNEYFKQLQKEEQNGR